MPELISLALLWVSWCALHSLLICRSVQSFARRILGRFGRASRIIYVLISVLTLLPLIGYQISLPQRLILSPSPLQYSVQGCLVLYGLLMFFLGARVYDLSTILGIRQWREGEGLEVGGDSGLRTDGILAHVRHPWYSGGIALIWGIGYVSDVFVLTRTILTAYLILGTFLEERRLLAELGDQYRAYRRTVPMLLPALRRRRDDIETP